MTEKVCKTCKASKPISDFPQYKTKVTEDSYRIGYRGYCKECYNVQRNELARNNPNRKAVANASARKWYANNPEGAKRARIRQSAKQLGFDPTMILAHYDSHSGLCDICHEESDRRLAIDHCHATGKFRGLLCHNCNLMLGHARDQQRILLLGMEYLNTHV